MLCAGAKVNETGDISTPVDGPSGVILLQGLSNTHVSQREAPFAPHVGLDLCPAAKCLQRLGSCETADYKSGETTVLRSSAVPQLDQNTLWRPLVRCLQFHHTRLRLGNTLGM